MDRDLISMDFTKIQPYVEQALTVETVIQTLWVGVALSVSVFIARRVRKTVDSSLNDDKKEWIDPVLRSMRPVIYPASLTAFFLIYIIAAEKLVFPRTLMGVALNLSLAWLAINFLTQFLRRGRLSRWIAAVIWGVAALHILGIWDTTLLLLNGIKFGLGEKTVSLLDMLRGLLSFAAFMWVAALLARLGDRQIRLVEDFTPSLQVLLSKMLKITLVVIALLFSLDAMGFDLTGLAIFSGAVGVGLGFGLQKVVSNFVSGIILLMDRSVKPGDVIAIDAGGEKTFGWVNHMGARYVSVIQRDGKEHLIPNELLITQKVENWSYTNDLIRLHIPIGVSYKSDIHKARELILEALREEPRIKDNPEPLVHMVGFGDSSVDFQARGWISDPVNGVTNIMSSVLVRVWDKFQAHGIEIPFPQRDLHVRSISEEVLKQLNKKGKAA